MKQIQQVVVRISATLALLVCVCLTKSEPFLNGTDGAPPKYKLSIAEKLKIDNKKN